MNIEDKEVVKIVENVIKEATTEQLTKLLALAGRLSRRLRDHLRLDFETFEYVRELTEVVGDIMLPAKPAMEEYNRKQDLVFEAQKKELVDSLMNNLVSQAKKEEPPLQ